MNAVDACPDDLLLNRMAAGDAAAVRLLVDRHLKRIQALARRLLANAADAEEVAQDTFLKAWQQAPNWQPGGARFSTWLHQVALNLCRDRLRARRPEQPLDEADWPASSASPERSALSMESLQGLDAALAQLPERQREAVVLFHYQDLSQQEAAALMGVGVEALESLLARGRRQLRVLLDPAKGNEP